MSAEHEQTSSLNPINSGELTIETFIEKHSCSKEGAIRLRDAYLKMIADCTHPLAISSAILNTTEGSTIQSLTIHLLRANSTMKGYIAEENFLKNSEGARKSGLISEQTKM